VNARTLTIAPKQMNHHAPTSADVARALESAARRIAPTVALLIALVIACYHAGRRCGLALYGLNDCLAAHWPTRPAHARPTPPQSPARPTPADALADRIRSLRADGLSQRAIAAACGISRATVRRRLAMA
jgi:hypothetical protein